MIDRNNPIPLYIQLKDKLHKSIKDGTWDVDMQIPTEKELMKKYGLGRATVREAISLLVNEGYLYKKKGIGTFVARNKPSLGFEPLISLTYSLKALGYEAKNIVVEKKKIVPDEDLKNKIDLNQGELYYLKRLRYVEDKPIAIEHSYFSKDFTEIQDNFDLGGSLAEIILKRMNLTIKKVDQTVIPRMPSEEERKELEIAKNTSILDLQRWIYIQGDEKPFYYLKFIVPGDIYSYPLRLKKM